jgi:[ribosomal protein S18]-alanine N-acetyltransferase
MGYDRCFFPILVVGMSILERFFARRAEFEIVAMEADHCEIVAVIHGERFLRGWSDGEFLDLLGQETVAGFAARQVGLTARDGIVGFVLTRAAAGEAEILSIGVTARAARQGLGWRLMRAALQDAAARDVDTVFLEVDETNMAARALYQKLGFRTVAERPAYYAGADGRKTAAHVMRLDMIPRGRIKGDKP